MLTRGGPYDSWILRLRSSVGSRSGSVAGCATRNVADVSSLSRQPNRHALTRSVAVSFLSLRAGSQGYNGRAGVGLEVALAFFSGQREQADRMADLVEEDVGVAGP